MSPEQAAAEDAVHRVREELARLVGKPIVLPPQVVSALANMMLGAVALAGGVPLRQAELAGINEATKIATDADAARELGR